MSPFVVWVHSRLYKCSELRAAKRSLSPCAQYVCEKKQMGAGGREVGGVASGEVHCQHANVVDRKRSCEDVMKLNSQNDISAGSSATQIFL